jgi:hypothetical protein
VEVTQILCHDDLRFGVDRRCQHMSVVGIGQI